MTDVKRRTLRLWAECERDLSFSSGSVGPLLGWADAMIELQLLREMDENEQRRMNRAKTNSKRKRHRV